jgi:hypothetical protein
MFHGKYVTITKVHPIAKIQTITIDVNVVDVNVTLRSKAIEEKMFKDREPKKTKSVVDRLISSSIPKVGTIVILVDNHMVVIPSTN